MRRIFGLTATVTTLKIRCRHTDAHAKDYDKATIRRDHAKLII